jgi:hypothetical protein
MGLVRELDKLAPHPALLLSLPAAPALGEKNVISSAFNVSTISDDMKAYLSDLPRRKGLERLIVRYRRRLASLSAISSFPAFALAA